MLSIRRFFDLLMFAGIIAGTLWINYLWPTRLFDLRGLAALAAAIAIIVFSIAMIYINRASESKKILVWIHEQNRKEQDRCEHHWQKKYALSEGKILRLEASRKVQLSELAKLVETIYKNGSETDVQAIKADTIAQMIVLLDSGVPFECLKSISPLALRDVVKACFDDGTFDIVDGPTWQRKLVRFAMRDPREIAPVETPSPTSS